MYTVIADETVKPIAYYVKRENGGYVKDKGKLLNFGTYANAVDSFDADRFTVETWTPIQFHDSI
jgi:hypothetical protein